MVECRVNSVEWNRIFRLFRFSGILGQPREVLPKFRNEIPENVCSIRSPTRNFWSNGKRPSAFPLWDVQLIWRAVIGFNWKWRNTSPLHVFSWSAWFSGKGKSMCIKFACLSYHSFRTFYMVDGGQSCFRSCERKVVSRPPLRADFTQQSSPRSSHGPLRKTNLFWAFLQQEVSHRFTWNLLPI